jgi:lysophospholipase L1-like esterase
VISASGGAGVSDRGGGQVGGTPNVDAAAGSSGGEGGAGGSVGGAAGSRGGSAGAAGSTGTGGGSRPMADASSDASSARRDAAPAVDAPAPTAPLTVFIAGDSTVMTYAANAIHQAGWGQMLGNDFLPLVTIDNRAIGGRTARRFIEEGRLDAILTAIHPGDYLLVQFGTNDSNTTATYVLNGQTIPYFLDANTDFKTYLMQYVDGARAKSATPVLVTPPPRNSAYCTGGNGLAAYAQAMRDLAAAQSIALSDLNAKTVAYLKAICPAPTPENFFLVNADGSVDGTHFQENGARILAGFVADGIRESGVPLARYLK